MNHYFTAIPLTNAVMSPSGENAVLTHPGATSGDLVYVGVSEVATRPGWAILLAPSPGEENMWTFRPLLLHELWEELFNKLWKPTAKRTAEDMFTPILESKPTQ